ncbi:glutaredoxin-like isoform X3 [Phalaenopsis equestris]|uniref:glutaredoxin-like isoform X3 n=1 Tax=Phalaenopsis equestris TaxID=78828 RepID=UPI0009E5FA5D|nr:glutaredoxin-like isoform X3 [Phalaenopsis equestris]
MEKAKELVSSSPVFFFSKTYCEACKEVAGFLLKSGANYKMVELDIETHVLLLNEGDGAALQSALAEWTGQRTVPNIFIGGNHIGGKADLMKKHKDGSLIALLREAGALPSSNPAV